jgi:hypothetical protein
MAFHGSQATAHDRYDHHARHSYHVKTQTRELAHGVPQKHSIAWRPSWLRTRTLATKLALHDAMPGIATSSSQRFCVLFSFVF